MHGLLSRAESPQCYCFLQLAATKPTLRSSVISNVLPEARKLLPSLRRRVLHSRGGCLPPVLPGDDRLLPSVPAPAPHGRGKDSPSGRVLLSRRPLRLSEPDCAEAILAVPLAEGGDRTEVSPDTILLAVLATARGSAASPPAHVLGTSMV